MFSASSRSLNLDDHKFLYVKHVSSNKDGKESTDCLYGNCIVNYDSEEMELHFRNHMGPWTLKKLVIYYKQSKIEEKTFENNGFSSNNFLNSISFGISIKDLNIQYYDQLEKKITFDLEYLNERGKCINSRYEIEFPLMKFQIAWRFSFLGFHHPKETICNVFGKNFTLTDCATDREKLMCQELETLRTTEPSERFNKDYVKYQKMMLSIEDLTVKKAVSGYTMLNKTINRIGMSRLFTITHDKDLPGNLGLNHVVITTMDLYEKYKDKLWEIEDRRSFNNILKIEQNSVTFERGKNSKLSTTTPYHIEFVENRVPIRLSHEILDQMKTLDLEDFFKNFDVKMLPNQKAVRAGDSNNNLLGTKEKIKIENWCNANVGRNREQKIAVENIVNESSFPLPYVIFGPPGTGKTSTLVEAIAQIVKLKPNAHVLVTANSNSACDEIAIRLLNFVKRHELYRLYSPSFERPEKKDRVHPVLKPLSNFRKDTNEFPTYEEIYCYKIVVSTLVNCGRMITANLKKDHFDYILIDECASTLEAHSIIPIVGLGCGRGKITANIVVGGDHKQLGPMIHSFYNERCGFDMSLMERLMLTEKYNQYPFDPHYVTQLSENYRSHWAIIRFSSFQFYHSQLIAKQSKEIANFALGWEKLPNKNFPVIFHSTLSPSEVLETSLYNMKEVEIVASYVKLLLQGINGKRVLESDIAIISPYSAQRKVLQEKFKVHPDIEIGTVDYYQGREKKIVIFSTVRSQTPTIGFLKNEKRLNVALTRAKSLMIVVGNGETLQKNKLWYKFINFCLQNDALVGDAFMVRYRVKKTGPRPAGITVPMSNNPIKPISFSPPKPENDSDSDDSLVHEDEKVLCKTIAVNDKKFKKPKSAPRPDHFYRDNDDCNVDIFYAPAPDSSDDEIQIVEDLEEAEIIAAASRIKLLEKPKPEPKLMENLGQSLKDMFESNIEKMAELIAQKASNSEKREESKPAEAQVEDTNKVESTTDQENESLVESTVTEESFLDASSVIEISDAGASNVVEISDAEVTEIYSLSSGESYESYTTISSTSNDDSSNVSCISFTSSFDLPHSTCSGECSLAAADSFTSNDFFKEHPENEANESLILGFLAEKFNESISDTSSNGWFDTKSSLNSTAAAAEFDIFDSEESLHLDILFEIPEVDEECTFMAPDSDALRNYRIRNLCREFKIVITDIKRNIKDLMSDF